MDIASPQSQSEIIQRFRSIIQEEAGPIVIQPDAEALLGRYLTEGSRRIMDAKPADRNALFEDAAKQLRAAVRSASVRVVRDPGTKDYRRRGGLAGGTHGGGGGPITKVDRREMSRLLIEFGPIPPFC